MWWLAVPVAGISSFLLARTLKGASDSSTQAHLYAAVARGRKRRRRVEVCDAQHPDYGTHMQRTTSLEGVRRLQQEADDIDSADLEGLLVLEYEYVVDDSPQGRVPLRIIRPELASGPLPVAILLHATGCSKDVMKPRMVEMARRGYLTAAIDCRYHGDRCVPVGWESVRDTYQQSLVRAWRGETDERPFLLDNVWDILHLIDVLEDRHDVDASRIGMTGVSLGGMHTWLAAVLDPRIAVAAPMMGCQGFKWALTSERYHGRVDSIPLVFWTAAQDMGKDAVDAEVVTAVWEKLLPGLLEHYDAPQSLACISPRPLLILNGERDERCPIAGLAPAVQAACVAYEADGAADDLKFYIEPGVGHVETASMHACIDEWFDAHLCPRPVLVSSCPALTL